MQHQLRSKHIENRAGTAFLPLTPGMDFKLLLHYQTEAS